MLLRFDAAAARIRRERNEGTRLAWLTARLGRSKDFPALASLQDSGAGKKARREQSWQEQLAIAEQWTAATRH